MRNIEFNKYMEGKSRNIFDESGIKYSTNIKPEQRIGLTVEQFIEYKRLKEENEKLNKVLENLKTTAAYMRKLAYDCIDISESMADSNSLNRGRVLAYEYILSVLEG